MTDIPSLTHMSYKDCMISDRKSLMYSGGNGVVTTYAPPEVKKVD